MLKLLLISDLPSSGPKILGVNSKYNIGDQITAECILPVSSPKAVLSWYINSDSADPSFVSDQTVKSIKSDRKLSDMKDLKGENSFEYFQYMIDTPYHGNTNSLASRKISIELPYSVLTISFIVKPKHLKQPEGSLSLKCTAEVLELYWRSTEVETLVKSLSSSWSLPSFSLSSIPVVSLWCLINLLFKHILL